MGGENTSAAGAPWRVETDVASLGAEQWRLDLAGPLAPGWAGNLAAGLSRNGISVERGHARGSAEGLWSARLEVRTSPAAADLRALDLAALLREDAGAAFGVALALDHFGLESALEHGGSLRVEIRAEDRIGFLAALLRRFAFFSLFPIELRLDTRHDRVVDEFFLRAGGDRAPSRAVADALGHALRALTARER